MSAHGFIGEAGPRDGRTVIEVVVDSFMVDVEATFCYQVICCVSGGGCDSAIAASGGVAWGKFRKRLPLLTTRHLSPKICGKVYETCICSAMLHVSETFGSNNPKLQWLYCNYYIMIHRICGIKGIDETPSSLLWQKFGIEDITLALHRRSTQMVWPCTAGHILESKEGLGRHGLVVWRLMSISVAWLELTRKAEMHGDLVFEIAWRSQPNRMGHGQHLNLNKNTDGRMELFGQCPCYWWVYL